MRKRYYLWVKTDMAKMGCDIKYQSLYLKPVNIWTSV